MINVSKRTLPEILIKTGLIFWALCVWMESLNMISLYIIVPCVFIYYFCRYSIFNTNRYFRLYMYLMVWIVLTCFGSHYIDISLKEIKSDIPVIMMCYICCCLAADYKNFRFLYWIWIAFFIGIFIYAFYSGLMSSMDIKNTRLNDAELNANTVAYATFYLTFSMYMLGELMHNKDLYRSLFFITIPLSFVISLLTASRQVLIIQIPLIAILLSIRYIGYVKRAKSLLIIIFLLLFGVFYVSDRVANVYQGSMLAQRSEKNIKEDGRAKLMKEAVDVGLSYPIAGVGPSNFREFCSKHKFSHCTYTELLACSGVPALLFYLLLIGVFIKKQISYYIETRDKIFWSFFVFGVIFFIDNFFYVFYLRIFLMPMVLIVGSHSDMYYREIKRQLYLS